MKQTEARKRANAKYRAKCKSINIQLFPADADIVEKLESVPVKSEYIKGLIRKDIASQSVLKD